MCFFIGGIVIGTLKFIDDAIERQIKDLHCAFLAKVVSVSGKTATVQPLGMVKEYGGKAKKQAIIENVPIAIQRVKEQSFTYVSSVSVVSGAIYVTAVVPQTKKQTVLVLDPIKTGDIVVCVCCDRDITDARNGSNSLPVVGYVHSMSDAVIVGVL